MKKLLVVLLAGLFILAATTVSLGAVTVTGTIPAVYDFYNHYDYFDKADLTFSDAVNDKLSTVVSFKWNYNYINGKTTATTLPVGASNGSYGQPNGSTGTMETPAGNMYPWIDQAYGMYKTNFGMFKIGQWNIQTWGGLQIMNSTVAPYRRMKTPFMLGWVAPQFFDGFVGEVDYARDGFQGVDDSLTSNPGSYVVTLGYHTSLWGFDYNYVNLQGANYVSALGDVGSSNYNNGKIGYVLNAYVQPVDILKLFAVIGQDQNNAKSAWIGANVNVAKWYGIFEYNTDKTTLQYNDGYTIATGFNPSVNNGQAGVQNEVGTNRYAWQIGYYFTDTFDLAFRYKLFDKNSTVLGGRMEEIRATIKFK